MQYINTCMLQQYEKKAKRHVCSVNHLYLPSKYGCFYYSTILVGLFHANATQSFDCLESNRNNYANTITYF